MPGMDNPIDENKIVSKFLVDSNQAVKFKLVRNEEEIQNDKVRFFGNGSKSKRSFLDIFQSRNVSSSLWSERKHIWLLKS